jgi:hypothetical protein
MPLAKLTASAWLVNRPWSYHHFLVFRKEMGLPIYCDLILDGAKNKPNHNVVIGPRSGCVSLHRR